MIKEVTTKFIAKDGMVFNREQDCLRYEQELFVNANHLILLDQKYQPLELVEDSFEEAIFFAVLDSVGLKYVQTIAHQHQWDSCLDTVGLWFYDEPNGDFVLLDEYIKETQKQYLVELEVASLLKEGTNFAKMGLKHLQKYVDML